MKGSKYKVAYREMACFFTLQPNQEFVYKLFVSRMSINATSFTYIRVLSLPLDLQFITAAQRDSRTSEEFAKDF